MSFIPSEERFYYYKIINNRKLYYFIDGIKINKNKIPNNILPNIKEYDPTLEYYESSSLYDKAVKNMTDIENKINNIKIFYKDLEIDINSSISKYGDEVRFTYQELCNKDPNFYFYEVVNKGKLKEKKVYYDYRKYKSVKDQNFILNLQGFPKNCKKPINRKVNEKNISDIINQIKSYKSRFLIFSKIIIFHELKENLSKFEKLLQKIFKNIFYYQDIINKTSDFVQHDKKEEINSKFQENLREYIQKRKSFYKEQFQNKYKNEYNDDYWKNFFNSYHPKSSNNDILKKYNIESRKDLLKWMLKGHPDKGGDLEVFKEVTEAARYIGYLKSGV